MKTLHEDPGHSWLEVPREELVRLGLAEKITTCSYQTHDGLIVFLEEDKDLTAYAFATGWNCSMLFEEWGDTVGGIKIVNYNTECWVRDLPSYRP